MARWLLWGPAWLALASAGLWTGVVLEHVTSTPSDEDTPIAAHTFPMATGLAVLVLVAAGVGLRSWGRSGPGTRGAGVVLAVALAASAHGWTRMYRVEDWYAVGTAVAAGLALLAALAPSGTSPARAPTTLTRVLAVPSLAAGALAALVTADYLRWGLVGVHEETEPGWVYGVPYAVAAAGLLATGIALWRRAWWGGLLTLGVTAGLVGAGLRDSTSV
jgi:hypothetical protein